MYPESVKITVECVLIPKREQIIVFGVDLKLDINLRRIILLDFIIVNLFGVGPLARVFHINLYVLV